MTRFRTAIYDDTTANYGELRRAKLSIFRWLPGADDCNLVIAF